MVRQFSQFFFLLQVSFFICVIAACESENSTNKNQQVNKTIPAELQPQEKVNNQPKIEENKHTVTENPTQPNSETNNVDQKGIQTEEKQVSEVDNVKAKLQ